jgi:hypothetical protein
MIFLISILRESRKLQGCARRISTHWKRNVVFDCLIKHGPDFDDELGFGTEEEEEGK